MKRLDSSRSLYITGAIFFSLSLIACNRLQVVNDPPAPKYDFEFIPQNEGEQIADITEKTMQLQHKRSIAFRDAQKGQKLRGVHPKSHGCVAAKLKINDDIPSNLQAGLFSKRGEQYKALIRFSNAAVTLAHDLDGKKNSSRGMAIKVFDVGGDVLSPDKGANNQDFLMINTPVFAFPNVRSYQRLTDALIESPDGSEPKAAFNPAGLPEGGEDIKNINKSMKVIAQITGKTMRNPLEARYWAAAPSSFGDDRVLKFSAEPCGGEQKANDIEDPSKVQPDYLHEALAARMKDDEAVCFDFKIQVLNSDQVRRQRNLDNSEGDLIEDATRVWDEREFPFVTVAKITIEAPQTVDLSDDMQQKCKSQAFNPWHSLTTHTPLGGINRLRRPVYIGSATNRVSKR